jgi:hypothetical protein
VLLPPSPVISVAGVTPYFFLFVFNNSLLGSLFSRLETISKKKDLETFQ